MTSFKDRVWLFFGITLCVVSVYYLVMFVILLVSDTATEEVAQHQPMSCKHGLIKECVDDVTGCKYWVAMSDTGVHISVRYGTSGRPLCDPKLAIRKKK